MNRTLYTLLVYLLLPFVPLKLLWRGIRQPEYLKHWGERFGYYRHKINHPLIWLHCVSVGETRAAAPLIQALLKQHPLHDILLTHATPTGREVGEQLFQATKFQQRIQCVYLPYDTPCATRRFIQHFQPTIGLLVETELWFNLIAQCKKREIPVLLVNARMSEKSANGYAKLGHLVREGLQNLCEVAAQTAQDAVRLRLLGASNVSVTGNLKFDVQVPANAKADGQNLRTLFNSQRPVFLAASTRNASADYEEKWVLDAINEAQKTIDNLLTIIVPRHPQRFDEVAALLKKNGVNFVRRSSLNTPLPAEVSVVLGDTMGELFTYYAACDIAFIGGSLLPLGGQNLIEAFALNKPVLMGPHTYNFATISENAVNQGAALRVQDAESLAKKIVDLLNNPLHLKKMQQAAMQFKKSQIGATNKTVKIVNTYI